MHCMILYTGTYSIMVMGLLYGLNDMVKCVCSIGLGSNGCFMAEAALMGHYKMEIISGVGYPRLDSVMPLVLCSVQYPRHRCCITRLSGQRQPY